VEELETDVKSAVLNNEGRFSSLGPWKSPREDTVVHKLWNVFYYHGWIKA